MIRNLLWAAPFALAVLALAAALLIEAAPATVGYAGLGVVASLGALGFLAIRTGQRRARQGEGAAELFRGALSGSREAWLITSLDGRTLYANRALRALAGGGSEAPSLNLLWPMGSSEAAQLETLRTEAASGRSASVELPLERGELRVFDVAVEPGAEGSLVWRLSELTEGRNRAAEMAAERDWFAGLIEHAPLGLFAADATGRFLYVNKTLARALGREAEELIGSGSTLGRFVLPSRGAEAEAVVWSEPGRGIGKAEVRLSGPGGEPWRALIAHHTVRLGADGSQPVTVGAVRNLDGEADWQEALKHSERRFRGLFDHAPIGIALLDLEGRVVESNSAFRALVGVGTEGGAARLLTDLLKGVDAGDVRAAVRSIVRGEKIQLPLEITLALPEDRVLLLYLSRLEEAGGALSGLIVHLIDNSEQRRLELQFAQAQKMQAVGQLAGGIAHDFNNVLTAVLGFCDLLLMRHQAGDHSFSDIMQIKQNATRATNLVRQLLAFSRQQTLKPKVTDLTDLLSELSHLLHRLIGENIEFKLVHERDLWLVKVDQGPFEQVIINLAVNARDSMSEGGTLTIRTQNAPAGTWTGPGRALLGGGDYVVIEVADTGVGIPRELHDKIFEPFFTTKEVGAGTGLGLSTVYGIVKQFHGFIFVDSAPGQGARFFIFLPRHLPKEQEQPKAAESEAPAPPPRDLTGMGTILLVEDEEAVRLFSARALRNKGYTVLEADSGDSALELIKSYAKPIDLLVTDIVMPRMDGRTLVEHVRRSRGEIKVIFISGYAEEDFRSQVAGEGAMNFLPKPFSIHQLATKVKEVISSANPRAA